MKPTSTHSPGLRLVVTTVVAGLAVLLSAVSSPREAAPVPAEALPPRPPERVLPVVAGPETVRWMLDIGSTAAVPALEALLLDTPAQEPRERLSYWLVEATATDWPHDRRGAFLRRLGPQAVATAMEHRVLPSVTLAQAILESGWGASNLARDAHNLFGMKARRGEASVDVVTYESGEPVHARFRLFRSWRDSVTSHAQLIGRAPRYARARAAWPDWRRTVEAIAPHYATDPAYVDRISALVERWRLDRWDGLVARAWL